MSDFITSLDVMYKCIVGFIVEFNSSIQSTSSVEVLEIDLRLVSIVDYNIQSSNLVNSLTSRSGIKEIVFNINSSTINNDPDIVLKTIEHIDFIVDSSSVVNRAEEKVKAISLVINQDSNLELEQLNLIIKGIKTVICRVFSNEAKVNTDISENLVKVTVKE